ncbi:MAG: hypothetical protein WC043_02215 [Pseudobdellovibrionaceae bacterium]
MISKTHVPPNYKNRSAIFFALLLSLLIHVNVSWAATSIPFTVTMSEAVNVTGSPRIVLDVDGTTRYATYNAGTGTASLTFTYAATAGDLDLDGINIASTSVDLNGGAITDLNGNALTNLTFTPPANMASVFINYPSLSMDFIYDADGRFTVNGTVYNDLSSFLTTSGGTFARASTASYYNSAGTLQTAASGTPRFDYDPATLTAKGILIEESRTNLFRRSAEIDVAPWGTSNSTISANTTTAPDGTVTAEKLVENASTGNKEFYQVVSTTSGATYIATIYAKAAERTQVRFNSTAGSSVFILTGSGSAAAGGSNTPSIQLINNGWYRLQISFPASGTSETIYFTLINGGLSNYTGDGSSGVYVWGAQLEQAAFPTSYIPTAAATITRLGDKLTVPSALWYNNTHGTMDAEFTTFGSTGSQTVWTLDPRLQLRQNTAGGNILAANGFSLGGMGYWLGVPANQLTKTSMSINTGNAAFVINGAVFSSTTTMTLGTPTSLEVGYYNTGEQLNGHIQKMKYYPLNASSAQMQLLTQ